MIQPDLLTSLVRDFGLVIVLFLSVIEGPIVTILSAWLAREGYLPLYGLGAILLAGDLIGDLLHYAVGRGGLARLPQRWHKKLLLDPARMARLAAHFDTYGGWTLVTAKLTHSFGTPVLVAAGLARMPLASFIVWNGLASLPKTIALMALGWHAGDAWQQVNVWFGQASWWVLAMGIALGAFVWIRRRR